jgi:hypothetical protein
MPKEQIVYALDYMGARTVLVAPNPTQAAGRLGLSKRLLQANMDKPSDSEINRALMAPGSIWRLPAESEEWVEEKISSKKLVEKTRGGSRGGGRKPIAVGGRAKQRSVSLDDTSWGAFLQLGGTPFLRNIVNDLKLTKPEWDALQAAGGDWLRIKLAELEPDTK